MRKYKRGRYLQLVQSKRGRRWLSFRKSLRVKWREFVNYRTINLILSGFIVWIAAVGAIYARYGERHDLFVYLSYAAPCVAGMVAGSQLFAVRASTADRRKLNGAYVISILFVACAFGCYVASEPLKLVVPVFSILMYLIISTVMFLLIAARKDWLGIFYSGNLSVPISCLSVIALTVFAVCVAISNARGWLPNPAEDAGQKSAPHQCKHDNSYFYNAVLLHADSPKFCQSCLYLYGGAKVCQ